DNGDPLADRANERKAVLREPNRELENVGQPPRSELAEQQQPGVERSGNNGGKQSRSRYLVEAELAEALDRRCGRRCSLSAENLHLVAVGAVEERREVTARPVQMRLDDLERETGRGGGIEGVAAPLEHRHPRRGREPVRRGD